MNAKYEGLARPISVTSSRYNEHLSKGSLLAEIGCNGDSLDEAILSARLLADSLALALS
jgi:stage II sporulation protein P